MSVVYGPPPTGEASGAVPVRAAVNDPRVA
jgi:hypothetical protein